MAARAAGSLCGCASKETGQELWTGHLAAWTCGGRGGWSPSGQAGFVPGLKMSAGHTCNLGKGFQKRKWGQGLLGWRSGENTGQPQILVRNKRQKPTDRLFSLVVSRGYRSRAGVVGGRRGPARFCAICHLTAGGQMNETGFALRELPAWRRGVTRPDPATI